jgi:hypothetical protein
MSDFIQSGLAGVNLHITHLRVLLTVTIIMAVWALASVLFGLLIGRAFQLFGHGHEYSEEILEEPRASDLACRWLHRHIAERKLAGGSRERQ